MIDLLEILDSCKDYQPITNPKTLEEFKDSTIHRDFQNEIVARIEQMRDYNENCKSNEYLETRGGIKALRLVMGIFDDLYANSIAELESATEENDDVEKV